MHKRRVAIDLAKLEVIGVPFQELKKRLEKPISNLHLVMVDIHDTSDKATVESILAEVPDQYLLMKSETGKLVIFSPKKTVIDRIDKVNRISPRAATHD